MTTRPSIWFRAVGFVTTFFVMTVFVMIAGLFSDPNLPLNQWLNRYGIPLLLGEVGLLIALGILAMLMDQKTAAQADLVLSPRPRLGGEGQGEGASASDDSRLAASTDAEEARSASEG